MNLKTITTQALLDYINRLSEQGYSDSEIIRKIKAVNDYISWGYNKGHISLSQFKQLESVLAKQQLKLTESYTDNSFSRALSSSFPISNSRIAAPLRNYAGTFALLLISSILISSIFVYVSKRGKSVLVYKSKASSESQTLTYKGQLTDKKGIPIVSPVQSIFRLYPNNTDTISIYDSGVCNVSPNEQGYIEVELGQDCGARIPTSLIESSAQLYLGMTIQGDKELAPRARIPQAGYALEAERIGTFSVPKTEIDSGSAKEFKGDSSAAAQSNTIPVINKSGNLVIAAKDPRIWSTSGTFQIRGQTISIAAESGSRGNISISPDIGAYTLITRGNVGIGTPQPSLFKLQVAGDIGPDVTSAYTLGSQVKRFKAIYADKIFAGETELANTETTQFWQINGGTLTPTTISSDILLGSTATESANIKLSATSGNPSFIKSGYVGINTTEPKTVLDVAGTVNLRGSSSTTGLFVTSQGNVGIGNKDPKIALNVTGSLAVSDEVTLGNASGDKVISKADDWTFQNATTLNLANSSTQSFTIESGLLNFDTANSRIGIGTTAPTDTLHVTGDVLATSGIHIGSDQDSTLIDDSSNGSGSTTLYIGNEAIDTSVSDERLKENIQNSTLGGLDLINKLNIKDFDWLPGNPRRNRGRSTGLIAQEVYETLPQVVRKPDNPDNTWSIEYNNLVPYVIKAVQELSSKLSENDLTQSEQSAQEINPATYVYDGDIQSNSLDQTFDSIHSSFVQTREIIADYASITGKLAVQSIDTIFIYTDDLIAKSIQTTNAVIKNLQAENINTEKLTAEQIEVMRLRTAQLNTEQITAEQIDADNISTETLTAQEVAVDGVLTANKIQSKTIDDLKNRLTTVSEEQKDDSQLTAEIAAVQEVLANLDNQPIEKVSKTTNLSSDITQSTNLTTFDNLLIYDTATLSDTTILGNLSIGSVSLHDNTILSLSPELRLDALESINLLDGAAVIARDGTVKIKGSLIAQGGVKTNEIRTDKDLSVVLGDSDSTAFQIVNSNGKTAASVDASGKAQFASVAIQNKSMQSDTTVASSEGEIAASVQTNAAAAGVASLPAYASKVTIYNEIVANDSLIYITPTTSTKNKTLFVSQIQDCQASELDQDSCLPYFTVAIDGPIPEDIIFNWWIVN